MNNNEEELQERIERLEKGEPLEDALLGLDADQREMVMLAASIRSVSFEQTAEVVRSQRDKVMGAAGSNRHPDVAPNQSPEMAAGFFPQLGSWLAGQFSPARAVAFAFLFVAVLFVGLWAARGRGNEGQEIASQDLARISPEEASLESDGTDAAVERSIGDSSAGASAGESAPVSELFIPMMSNPLPLAPDKATVREAKGLVEIRSADGQWRTVNGSAVLGVGESLRTAGFSGAHLEFYDGSQANIGPNSELEIEQLDALQRDQGFRTVVLNQRIGVSEHYVDFRNDAGSRYEVKTPSGSGIARGTFFTVNVDEEAQSRYTVREGKVDVTSLGASVSVVAGQMTGFSVSEAPSQPQHLVTGEGTLTQMGDIWIIAGQRFSVTADTTILGDPQLGDLVEVEARAQAGGPPVAELIRLQWSPPKNEFTITGPVEEIDGLRWVVSGQEITITPETLIASGIEVGDEVRVRGTIQLPGGDLVARSIELMDDGRGHPFEFAGIVQSLGATSWQISGITIAIDEETEIEGDIFEGDLVKVEGWILADDTWLAHEIKLLEPHQSTFAFSGHVLNIDPWNVDGVLFEVRDWTLIEAGIELGDLVRVSGIILDDGTWVAERIEKIDDRLFRLVFVGYVDSIDPWSIAGLPIATDENTDIDDQIEVGDLVKVTVWVQADGTWLARRIEWLSSGAEEGCVLITAVITAINGDQISLSDGQVITLGDTEIEGDLRVNAVAAIVACVNEDGEIEIVSITIIYVPPVRPPQPPLPPGPPGEDRPERVTLCHKPGTPAEKTKTLPSSALFGHLGHGDTLGPCD